MDDPDIASAKRELREELITARRARTPDQVAAARSAIREHVLARPPVDCVAAYVPLRSEPGSIELLAGLRERGTRVLVPLMLPDRDLGWAEWGPDGAGPALGSAALDAAGLVLVPALAVGRDGTRLGRGGGSYDRALVRRAPDALLAALVYADEVVDMLPRDAWDVPVAAAVTPEGWVQLGREC